tara:strand:- start:2978 stop:3610 length:633 start_codon:yes stop_codon:yes gene_type:complete
MEMTINEALNKGIEAQRAGQRQKANNFYMAILKEQPLHPDANHNMGVLALDNGRTTQALEFFKIALAQNPSVSQFWLSCIRTHIRLGQLEEAKQLFKEADESGITKDPFALIRQQLNNFASSKKNIPDARRSKGYLTTKTVAKKAGVHRDTLLRWLREQSIPEPQRDHRGWRVFSFLEAEEVLRFANEGKWELMNSNIEIKTDAMNWFSM